MCTVVCHASFYTVNTNTTMSSNLVIYCTGTRASIGGSPYIIIISTHTLLYNTNQTLNLL